MGYKEYDRNISFTEMEMSQIVGSSRTQKLLREMLILIGPQLTIFCWINTLSVNLL